MRIATCPPLALALGLFAGCEQAPQSEEEAVPVAADLGPAQRWLPIEVGTEWWWDTLRGPFEERVHYRVESGDRRSLPDQDSVLFVYAYGTVEGHSDATERCIYALTDDGPREVFLDTGLFALEFQPPLPVLPPRVEVGAHWTWEGTVGGGGMPITGVSHFRLEAEDDVVIDGVRRRCVRSVQTHGQDLDVDLVIGRWFVEGVGMVQMESRGRAGNSQLHRYYPPQESGQAPATDPD